MILSSEEVNSRLNSEDNLVNRFRKLTSASVVSLPDVNTSRTVFESVNSDENAPSIDSLVENVDDKVNSQKGISNAKAVLALVTDRLKARLTEVDKPVDLARIAAEMNKIVNGEGDKGNKTQNNIVIYRPALNDVNVYPTVISVE